MHQAPIIEKVTAARLSFLEEIYRVFRLESTRAQFWARSAYSTYLWLQVLRHTLPHDSRSATVTPEDIAELVEQLTPAAFRSIA